jgi:hypothetical protein
VLSFVKIYDIGLFESYVLIHGDLCNRSMASVGFCRYSW